MAGLGSLVSTRAAIGIVVLVALGTLGIAAPVAAANKTTFDVGIDDCVIRGSGGPGHGHVKVERRSADGALRELADVDSYGGYWGTDVTEDCFVQDIVRGTELTITVRLASGDQVKQIVIVE